VHRAPNSGIPGADGTPKSSLCLLPKKSAKPGIFSCETGILPVAKKYPRNSALFQV